MKTPKKTDEFIIKLTKQIDSNTQNIRKLFDIISKKELKENSFNIQADFQHLTTLQDKKFLTEFGNNIAQILQTKGIKSFQMTYKK